MATVTAPSMTAAEFYEFVHRPENRDRILELERGEIVEMSRPGKRLGLVCANVARILGNYSASTKTGYVCSNDTGVIVERGRLPIRIKLSCNVARVAMSDQPQIAPINADSKRTCKSA